MGNSCLPEFFLRLKVLCNGPQERGFASSLVGSCLGGGYMYLERSCPVRGCPDTLQFMSVSCKMPKQWAFSFTDSFNLISIVGIAGLNNPWTWFVDLEQSFEHQNLNTIKMSLLSRMPKNGFWLMFQNVPFINFKTVCFATYTLEKWHALVHCYN